jgi:hypothetical protein
VHCGEPEVLLLYFSGGRDGIGTIYDYIANKAPKCQRYHHHRGQKGAQWYISGINRIKKKNKTKGMRRKGIQRMGMEESKETRLLHNACKKGTVIAVIRNERTDGRGMTRKQSSCMNARNEEGKREGMFRLSSKPRRTEYKVSRIW